MDVFGKDAVIGDFRLSDYGFVLGSFSYDNEDIDLGMENETTETFIGNNHVPVYLGSKTTGKLKPRLTIIQNECVTDRIYFTLNECRMITSKLIGNQGYKKLYIEDDKGNETVFYNIRFNSAHYEKSYDKVIGITFEGECDSQFAWTDEITQKFITTEKYEHISIYNDSDDLYNYLLPKVNIHITDETLARETESLTIRNINENRDTIMEIKYDMFNNLKDFEMDSKKNILRYRKNDLVFLESNYEGFNMNFIRLVPGDNHFTVSLPCEIVFKYSLPRKVGFY